MTNSPRTSTDAAQSPTSPFLHNLTQRLRKGSSASHASTHSSDTAASHPEPPEKLEDPVSTKRYLLSITRNDWEWPATEPNTINPRNPINYRQRDESVSDYSSSAEAESSNGTKDAYKFDSPDAVGAAVEERKLRKKRLLDEEMAWNNGLSLWTKRRDAWTGAVSTIPHKSSTSSSAKRRKSRLSTTFHARDRNRNSSESTTYSTSSASPSIPHPDPSTNAQATPLSPINTRDPATSLDADQERFPDLDEDQESPASRTTSNTPAGLLGPYLPLYPPLLPASHTLRARIKPTAYPAIYSKVVVQSMTPNVPIPLSHMINALVDGWKSEGNWPPQLTGNPDGLNGKKGRKGNRDKTAFARWKREQDERKRLAVERVAAMDAARGNGVQGMRLGGGGSGRRSLGGLVKKVFGVGDEIEDEEKDLAKMGLTFEEDENVTLNMGLVHGQQ